MTGEKDEYGLPVRYPWARDYRGPATVLYGHTPVTEVAWINNTACLDTGCVFGGQLSAMRYPEREVVAVDALREHSEPIRPLESPHGPQREPGVLSMEDVTGPLHLKAKGLGTIRIRQEQAAGALETMSRFAIDPRWLRYLPPTMAPAESSKSPGYLEHPTEAFTYFRKQGITTVVCEEKHMDPGRCCCSAAIPSALTHRLSGWGPCTPEPGDRFWRRRRARATATGAPDL